MDLKGIKIVKQSLIACTFTFQYGWIWKAQLFQNQIRNKQFTFQYGWIWKPCFPARRQARSRFTFQYGWIWKWSDVTAKYFISPIYIPIWVDLKVTKPQVLCPAFLDLHSNMGGFERIAMSIKAIKDTNLHSNMGGFESFAQKLIIALFGHLHSNMGGFESKSGKKVKVNHKIYIPIWVDLKVRANSTLCTV